MRKFIFAIALLAFAGHAQACNYVAAVQAVYAAPAVCAPAVYAAPVIQYAVPVQAYAVQQVQVQQVYSPYAAVQVNANVRVREVRSSVRSRSVVRQRTVIRSR